MSETFGPTIRISTLSDRDRELLEERCKARRGIKPLAGASRDEPLVEALADWLVPHFATGSCCNFTGTYRDDYGYSHGLMLARNGLKDFCAFLRDLSLLDRPYHVGIEVHPRTQRRILHLHALIGGDFSKSDLALLKAEWTHSRGWCQPKHVFDRTGCIEYAIEHLMKQGHSRRFDWDFRLPERAFRSRHERRLHKASQTL